MQQQPGSGPDNRWRVAASTTFDFWCFWRTRMPARGWGWGNLWRSMAQSSTSTPFSACIMASRVHLGMFTTMCCLVFGQMPLRGASSVLSMATPLGLRAIDYESGRASKGKGKGTQQRTCTEHVHSRTHIVPCTCFAANCELFWY